MNRAALFPTLASATVALCLALFLALPSAWAGSSSVECQHPLTTGVEVSARHHVSAVTACRVALALYRYATSAHVVVNCTSDNKPVLVLRRFEHWTLSLRGGFHMKKGASSFAVSGTDFPAPCG
jgi:hypothetical protein